MNLKARLRQIFARRSTGLLLTLLSTVLLAGISSSALATTGEGEARLLRYPAIHGNFVVFVYGGDLWRAPTDGGRAWRLTSHPGVELTPKISPDGSLVAYSAEYSGTRQVHVIPSGGGEARQLTFYNDVGTMPPRGGFDYWIQGWSPEGEILVRMNRTPWGPRPGRYFLVDPDGGLERPLPIEVGGSASFGPDGSRLAYTYYDREFRTWKRYQGGRNQDIWTFDLEAMQSERRTDFPGSDNFPMWHRDTIYFTSDRDHTLNLFALDLETDELRQVTDFDEYDVLWPSLGPEAIVFMNGGWLYRLELDTEEVAKIPVTLGNDLPHTVPHWEEVDDNIAAANLSPGGERAIFEARGDLFTVPAEHGATRNLTDTQGVRESAPSWSPDGRWIAYWSDTTGEMELYLRPQTEKGVGTSEPRQLTRGGSMWRYPALWSPDGEKLAFADSAARLQILEVDSGEITLVDTGDEGDLDTYRWSPDSRWLAYERSHPETELPSLALYSLEEDEATVLGDGTTFDFQPVFGADGKHLFFLSNRDYNLTVSAFEFDFVYDDATRVYAFALDPGAEPLFPPRSDEVEVDGGEGDENEEKGGADEPDDEEKDENPPTVVVEPEGFAVRTVALPGLSAGNYADLSAVEGGVLYRTFPEGDSPKLMRYDLKKREAKEIASGVSSYVLGADGEQVLYRSGEEWSIASASANGEEAKTLDLSGLRMKIDPRAEWRQMFAEAWRLGRDFFYDPEMHGVDWEAMRERYGALLPWVAHRSDLDFLFSHMVAELEAGHAYVQRGEEPEIERVEGGMLGAELEADESGRYRIARIFPGENWHEDYRSPLTEPGVEVEEGDFLLAVDGRELTTDENPYRLLQGKGDRQVTITVNEEPSLDGARTETVRTVTSETNLRYLAWVRTKAELVDRLSDGRIGYIHLPNTAQAGNRMLQKLFYSQVSKPALIVDERYNGGGFIPVQMIDMLSRTTLSYWARRGLEAFSSPGYVHDGPMAMLINGYAASGGDALPYYFRKEGLGPIIGTTTWGGLIGVSGNPMLVDGGGVLYPTFRFFTTEGEWAVEGEGVDPDIEVWDRPEEIAAGNDPSIEKAVEVLLEELEAYEPPPTAPEPPDVTVD
ncbi:MAG: PDZ domain-containing protein [Thermoanaerobaculia bacterium]|nr:PDZ domain-containing protein [Thermoanaerobaculia bacterium]